MARQTVSFSSSFRPGDIILVRHLALCLTTLVIYFLRETSEAGQAILWIVGAIAVLNLALGFHNATPRQASFTSILSAGSGLFGWAALTFSTGGSGSPLAFGFSFEIILSVLHAAPRRTLLMTAGALAALWGQQLLRPAPLPVSLWLQTALLLSCGGLVSHLASRGKVRSASLASQIDSLLRRLESLQREIEDSRQPGTRGSRSAQPPQHLLNLAQNLRGLSQQLRSELEGPPRDRKTIMGLLASIERLESLVRDALRSSRRGKNDRPDRAAGQEVFASLDEVIEQTARSFPSVRWITSAPSRLPDIRMPADRLNEVLQILVRNAAEASPAAGEVHLSIEPRRRHLELQIRDQGGGPSAYGEPDLLPPPGSEMRKGGRYRLFLARQLLRVYGGRMNARPAPGGGAELSLRLPLAHDSGRDLSEPQPRRRRPVGPAGKRSLDDFESRVDNRPDGEENR